jgi:hypothetical protein
MIRRRLAPVVVLLVLSQAACANGKGSMDYEMIDAFGVFSGSIAAGKCTAFVGAPSALPWAIYFSKYAPHGGIRFDAVHIASGPPDIVTVTGRDQSWMLRREDCAVFDVRYWYEGDALRVVARLDCTLPRAPAAPPSTTGPHIHGTVWSNACEVEGRE